MVGVGGLGVGWYVRGGDVGGVGEGGDVVDLGEVVVGEGEGG